MVVTINKSIANGVVEAPPSKSYAHRLLICAALSNKPSKVKNISLSNDILATINCLKTLGYDILIKGDTALINKTNTILDDTLVFNCDESGSTFRFMMPIALTTGKKVKFIRTKRLIERGIGPYEEIFNLCNIEILKEDTSITLCGKLKPDHYKLVGNISSQFISGLLFALPLLNDKSIIEVTTTLESKNYIDITLDTLNQAGLNIRQDLNKYYIEPSIYKTCEYLVEGDYSNSSFLDAFNYFNGNVIINGLNKNSFQGDTVYKEYFDKLNEGYQEIDISNCIDLGPVLFCFASLKNGGHFLNTRRLKIKESDRVEAVKEELAKFGVELIDNGNDVIINKENIHAPNEILNGQNDHRIVMALSLMLSVYSGKIEGCEAVRKSYPNYFKDLERLGIEVTYNDK